MKKNKSLVSIIIVNWNGKKYLEKCLSSLQKITYKPVEVIVVDQASNDRSQELVKKKYSHVKLIENTENTGYVGGNNIGVANASGKYIMILNNDIEVDKNFLEPLVKAMEENPKIGCVQPKAINLRFKDTLDGAGSFITNTGFLYHKGYLEDKDSPECNVRYPVYSVKGAYLFTQRELFEKIGGLDPDFFIYFEESDYCGRLWVAGYSVEYIPDSVVYHWGAGDTSHDWAKRFALVQYRSYKNRLCSYLKNLSGEKLIQILPIYIILCIAGSFFYLFIGKWRMFFAIYQAFGWNIIHFPKTLAKRRFIQGLRKQSDDFIFKRVEKNMGPLYYIRQVKLLSK